jgi:hypothetical protein
MLRDNVLPSSMEAIKVFVRTYFWRLRWGRHSRVDRCSNYYVIGDLRRFINALTNPRDSAARAEVGPHNTIGLAMEDLPEAERRALEKELELEMAEARRRKLACFQQTHWG